MKLSPHHWIILAGCFVAIGTMGSAFDTWADVLSPKFVFGVLGVIGSNIAGFYAPRPKS